MKAIYPTEWPQFFTATILHWKPILLNDNYKDLIIDGLRFAITERRINLTAFVIMSNHIHIVWQQLPPYTKSQVQLGFMKYTAQKIKYDLQKTNPELLKEFKVDAKDREYQLWKRNPLSIELFTPAVFHQKIDYIHNNPVRAGLCKLPEDYKYSSAGYYETVVDQFGLFTSSAAVK